ncbi:probable RNA-binding protein CG14230 isoform X2 [Ostrinia nubilalis]|uniref:probable RNA-binding protein CG14230 isoform X2 n=1 Tax=Ostrinia nubilalis TaxID=29057 RepID=UPI003082564D
MSSHTRLFVGNVPENATQDDLLKAFSSYGQLIINVDLKNKSNTESDQKKFAFITLSASNYEVESCIKHFSNGDFGGSRLYVTRARESFLERLQRERSEAQRKETEKQDQVEDLPKKNPVIKLGDKLNPRKRKLDHTSSENNKALKVLKPYEKKKNQLHEDLQNGDNTNKDSNIDENDKKKKDSDKKRMESLKKKRQEFKQKQMIIKTGLIGVDKAPNKKVIFSDNEEETESKIVNGKENMKTSKSTDQKNTLFDDDDSGDEVNFEIKKQFEGKKGQKVLDLQSRYKSDKRFILDERFIEDDQSEEEGGQGKPDEEERIDLNNADEKTKQLNILQDVLGVSIKARPTDNDSRKIKTKLGMLRFDPSQPEHAKFLAPVEETKEPAKKSKKKLKDKQEEQKTETVETEVDKIEVSKEQFYKVTETLKEALVQPTTFSLRSLFGQNEETEKAPDQNTDYIAIEKPKVPKVKNPLDPSGKKNPFVYDSSDSEDEEVSKDKKQETLQETKIETAEPKAVWRENLFFSTSDSRLQDGLAFFNKTETNEPHKERRELKSVMKKRIYNKERKNQMFQKKIGGRKKSLKKSYRIKS